MSADKDNLNTNETVIARNGSDVAISLVLNNGITTHSPNARNDKNSFKPAFTLAELMVIMAVMTVVLAAVAPIFTSRYSNMSADTVWGTVGASNMNDIYTDAPIRSMMNEVIIGATPADMEDIRRHYQPYSKVIIRSSDRVGGNKRQKQIEFRQNGATRGYLFAANSNLLFGASYNNINFNYIQPDLKDITRLTVDTNGAYGNTAMGKNALNALTTGKENSAFGYKSLSSVTTGSANTAAGTWSGTNLKTGTGNTLIGYNSYDATKGNYNTILSNNTESISKESNYTTAVGNNIPVKGDYNVAVGDSSAAIGYYNTAIGYGTMQPSSVEDSYTSFKYNTAIGYNACKGIGKSAQYKTCIGGIGVDAEKMNSTAQAFFTDSTERVLIGRPATAFNSAATLEVHNITSAPSGKYPYPNNLSGAPKPGDASVVVNGNLIVRGQTYMLGRSPFPIAPNAASSTYANTVSLMGFKLYKESLLDHKPLIGWDGSEYTQRIKNAEHYLREAFTGREHCICTYSCTNSKDYNTNGYSGRDSYEWSYLAFKSYPDIFDNSFGGNNYFWMTGSHKCGNSYYGNVYTAANIELDASHNITEGNLDSTVEQLLSGGSCCPILTESGSRRRDSLPGEENTEEVSSDIRLKNVGSEFKTGFETLAKLKIYNFRFKNDKSRNLHSGVIAQNLKQVFPNSVSKDEKGYYKIRKDEMFYAAVNSVKEFYAKIVDLTKRIANDIARITALKKENKELKNKLLLLSEELDKLEK